MATAKARAKPKGRASVASVRRLVSEAVSEGYDKAYVLELIEAAKGAEVVAGAVCDECGGEMRVKVPDVKKQLDTLVALLTEAEGKAAQAVPEATTVVVERVAL